jgi:transcriptional regulator with XRE-family HTH domain
MAATITQDLADKIAAEMTRKRVSQTLLAERSGIPYSTLNRKLGGYSTFNMVEVFRIAQALEVAPVAILPASFTGEKSVAA